MRRSRRQVGDRGVNVDDRLAVIMSVARARLRCVEVALGWGHHAFDSERRHAAAERVRGRHGGELGPRDGGEHGRCVGVVGFDGYGGEGFYLSVEAAVGREAVTCGRWWWWSEPCVSR